MDSKTTTLAGDKENERSAASSLNKETGVTSDVPAQQEKQDGIEAVEPEVDVEEAAGEYPTGFRMAMIVVALVLSIFLVALDMTIIATAIPKITDEFNGLDLVGWYGSAFFLTVAAFQSTWGKAYKYFPLKFSFLLSIFIFELGSLICGVAPNSTALIVGRAIAGVGGAGIASGAYTIIAFSAPPASRAAFTGLLGASYGIASVVGPLLGGVFAEKVTWRWCFYINLPIGGLAGGIILLFFKTPSQAVPAKATLLEKLLQMDLPGAAVIIAGVVCYVLALQWGGQTKPWSSSDVIGLLVGFGLFVILFIVIEYFQGERAMIVGRIAKQRVVLVGMTYVFFLAGGFFLFLYYLPIYFQVVDGVTASESGVRNLPLILAVTVATIGSGIAISAFGHFVPFLVVGGVLTTVGSGLLYTLSVTSGHSMWIGYQVVTGLGIGLALQVPVISAQATVPASDLASVTAMILFFQTVGGAFFVSAGEAAFTNVLSQRLPYTAPGVDVMTVVQTGVTEIRNKFDPSVVPGIINAYMDGLKVAYAVAIATAGIATLASLGSKWINLKGKVVAGGAA